MKSRIIIALFLIIFSHTLKASVAAEQVPILNLKDQPIFTSIPTISMVFWGEQGATDREVAKEKCQNWVADYLKQRPFEKVFEAACLYEKDVVLRRHIFTGQILLKNW